MVLGITTQLSICRNLLEIIQLCSLFLVLDNPKYSYKKTIFYYIFFILFHVLVGTIWVSVDSESFAKYCTISIVIWSILFFYSLSKDTLFQVIYNVCLQTFVLLFGIYISISLTNIFCNGNPWIDILFRILYFVFVLCAYYYALRKTYRELANTFKINWRILALIAFLGDILVIYCGMHPTHVMIRSLREQILFVGICTILFATHIVMLQMMFTMLKENLIKEELKYTAMNNAFLEKEFSEIQKSIWTSKRIRHDSRHHNLIIAEYAKKGDIDGLLQYLSEQEQEIESNAFKLYCENRTINSIFTVYAEKAEMAGITISVDAKVGNDINIRDIDLTAILGNMLDNAIHGCQQSGKTPTKIDAVLHIKCRKLAIIVKNTCSDDIYFEQGIPKSKQKEGIGIQSIIRSVNIYNGNIDFKCENNLFLCRVLIEV
ncbi:GHKL domain-containing protein [Lachnospiraceae bacterium 46-61]